jgi:hypothetical protein
MRLWSAAVALLVILGAPLVARPAAAAWPEPAVDGGDRARTRLLGLFAATDATSARNPASPRFAALREPSFRGTRLLVGWILPELDQRERVALEELATALGRSDDGAVPAAFGALGAQLAVAVSIEAFRDVPVLCIDLALPRAGASRDLELAVLRAVSELASREASPTAALARTRLRALNRAVVEVHPPGPAAVAVRVTKPLRHVGEHRDTPRLHVAKSGDTLAKVPRRAGLSEPALREANRLAAPRLRRGQKVVLPR